MYSVTNHGDIIKMFSWCGDSMLISYSEGITGEGYWDDPDNPSWAAVFTGDFCFLAGTPAKSNELAKLINQRGKDIVVIPQTSHWLQPLLQCECRLAEVKRYHLRLPAKGFDLKKLEKLASEICKIKGTSLVKAGEREYNMLKECKWENSFVSNFKDYDDYRRNGLGYVILIDGELASAATSFGYYSGGMEIQIATNPKYRKMGLASICSAAFVAECAQRGIRPHWDAANLISVKIAEKIGFEYDGEYCALCYDEKSEK